MLRTKPIYMLISLLLGIGLWSYAWAAEPSKRILALGDGSYLPGEVMGGEVTRELGDRKLMDFAVVILSNVSYQQLPGALRERLTAFLNQGGSLLITGGSNAYGSGGYQPMAPLIPFEIRTSEDWRAVPFKEVIPLETGHPILQGVTFRPVGWFNDLNPKPGVTEIAQYAGGKTGYPSPLIAEQQVGQGTVLGVAFNLGQEVQSGWADGNRFVRNILTYLTTRSP